MEESLQVQSSCKTRKKKLFIPISKSNYLILLYDTLTRFSFAALKFNIGNCHYFGTG